MSEEPQKSHFSCLQMPLLLFIKNPLRFGCLTIVFKPFDTFLNVSNDASHHIFKIAF